MIPKRAQTPILVLVLTLLGVVIWQYGFELILSYGYAPTNHNRLLLGESAPEGVMAIPLVPAPELDGLSADAVRDLRRRAVQRHPELLATGYQPSVAVYGAIRDGLPWNGIKGQFVFGHGEDAHRGPSEEGRFIANPLLLAGAEFSALGALNPDFVWQKEALTSRTQFVMPAHSLRISAQNRIGVVRYALGNWYNDLWEDATGLPQFPIPFRIKAQNARDLGFNYVALDQPRSFAISARAEDFKVTRLAAYIRSTPECGLPEGCNNQPSTEFRLEIQQTPAILTLRFWIEAPPNAQAEADMSFVIHLE